MIISFGWTTEALLAGQKSVTRRDWNEKHAAKFTAGMVVDAWNTSPRNVKKHPRKVATIRLTETPYWEETCGIMREEWAAEGFEYMTKKGLDLDGMPPIILWDLWHMEGGRFSYVVRFQVLEYLEGPLAMTTHVPDVGEQVSKR